MLFSEIKKVIDIFFSKRCEENIMIFVLYFEATYTITIKHACLYLCIK